MRKKILILAVSMVVSMVGFAQGAVYFGSLSKQISIGVSKVQDMRKDMTFSIMQMTKSKNFDSFSITAFDKDGNEVKLNLRPDTTYHMQMDKKLYAHQQDYSIGRMEYLNLQRALSDTQSVVYVNGLECNGLAFVSILNSLQSSPIEFSPNGMRFNGGRVWGFPQGHMVFMRYRSNDGKKRDMFVRFHDFRETQNSK